MSGFFRRAAAAVANGLKPINGDGLLSIGAARLRDTESIERLEIVVNPGRPIPPEGIR